ncbi:MAG: hypothetical protein ACK521_02515 [bacterium]
MESEDSNEVVSFILFIFLYSNSPQTTSQSNNTMIKLRRVRVKLPEKESSWFKMERRITTESERAFYFRSIRL